MTLYADTPKTLTITDLMAMKAAGEKIACLTAYDASFAGLLDSAGIDILLVGDSLGMVIQGYSSTLPVSVDDMIYHSRSVARARKRAFLIADLPFASYATPTMALMNAARLMQSADVQMIKIEGCHIETFITLTAQGIPVCGHLGLLPQSVHRLGGYRVQGRQQAQASRILDDALAIERAGAQLLVLECVPAGLASDIAHKLRIPVIGIGAGADCDGQVLVLYDMLDIGVGHRPRFSKNFMTGNDSIAAAIRHYCTDVKRGVFPGPEHSY
ncbi:MAG: 3-methyl-2-oxobutanoate hydroxymethyltransferase [Methylomonas sp.]|nr:3-methyl-2-oxobutanoate hydroxymethyltransferase [Methylomonas sp.]PPD19937.1 MAG: 3-methyl-2-oxobutanoate hydroxymethyltransferase [Methylomonas sp.]PPD26653.1 MAG: 3-methyl-2-oxobutanoate hydroxymethyltransferase [Methylomonas sp.]PPD38462.1 MAG: 3-methyl-2-oxobutanoate hydroxymethyltransferase [Methylomonas sp.]PPD39701.1 MAG: 3-methyl-2-oxobutanoate hydroxymethyltransferase [Methylomonas sp.]